MLGRWHPVLATLIFIKWGFGMKYISSEQVENLIDFDSCIPLMEKTLKELANGVAMQPLRQALPLGNANWLGIMPSALSSRGVAGCKVISIFPQNHSKGLHSHQGVVLLFEAETGSLLAILDAISITSMRTAAVSAVATAALSRADSRVLSVLGAGVQARAHVEALRKVRDIREVRVWSPNPATCAKFATQVEQAELPVTVCSSSSEAVKNADIICAVSAATEPILFGKDLSPGVHINAVGACTPRNRELDTQAVAAARMFGDRMESVFAEAGDFLIPLSLGELPKEHLLGDLGDVLIGKLEGRTSAQDITLFKSLGLGIQDLASAELVYSRQTHSVCR